MTENFITKDTLQRLIADIKEVKMSKLSKDGIYYEHDETNILVGRCVIVGPKDTPYAFGNYCFEFTFPTDYPHSPPVLKYLTNDGQTRFHPNYYKDGKVCISALNTWKGEQWTGCLTIKAILLILCSLFTENPLINEPGITISHRDNVPYNKIVTYKNFEVAIIGILNKKFLPKDFTIFQDVIEENFKKNYDKILKNIKEFFKNVKDLEQIRTDCYRLSIVCKQTVINKNLQIVHEKLCK